MSGVLGNTIVNVPGPVANLKHVIVANKSAH